MTTELLENDVEREEVFHEQSDDVVVGQTNNDEDTHEVCFIHIAFTREEYESFKAAFDQSGVRTSRTMSFKDKVDALADLLKDAAKAM